jgi:hypothetical protein
MEIQFNCLYIFFCIYFLPRQLPWLSQRKLRPTFRPFTREIYKYASLKKIVHLQGRIQDFKLGGAHLKKLRRAEEGPKIFGVIRVKNHYFRPKNHIFFNCGGRRESFWGISCEKSRFYAKKIIFSPILGGGAPPAGSAPDLYMKYECQILVTLVICT